jgi:hypothetical protein
MAAMKRQLFNTSKLFVKKVWRRRLGLARPRVPVGQSRQLFDERFEQPDHALNHLSLNAFFS